MAVTQKPKVLFKKNCKVCGLNINFIEDLFYAKKNGTAFTSEPNTLMCDSAHPDGCYQTYHSECFAKHRCPAYNG